MPRRDRPNTLVAIIMLAAVALAAAYAAGFLSILPGPEGPEAVIYGFNPWGTSSPGDIVVIGETDGPYSTRGDTHNALLSYENPNDYELMMNAFFQRIVISRSLYVEVRVQPISGAPVERKNITVETGDGVKKVYWLEAYDFDVEVAISPRKAPTSVDGLYHYAAGPNKYPWDIVLKLGSVDWAPSGALEHRAKPVAAYVVDVWSPEVKERSEGDTGRCEPPPDYEVENAIRTAVYKGSKLDLWTEPYQGKAGDYFQNIGSSYEEAIRSLPDTAYVIINFPRLSAAYKVNTWVDYTPMPVSKWCVSYVFPVEVIRVRVWYLRFAEYSVPEDGMPTEWGNKTPAVGSEEGGMADQVFSLFADPFARLALIAVLVAAGAVIIFVFGLGIGRGFSGKA